MVSTTFIKEEISRRRRNSAWLAGVLFSATALLYGLGFFIPR